MLWLFEHGSHSDRHLAPALHGPADANIPALYREFVSAARGVDVEYPVQIQGLSKADQGKMRLDLGRARNDGFEEYEHADLFAAWLLQNKTGWSRATERRVCVDSDPLRRMWYE